MKKQIHTGRSAKKDRDVLIENTKGAFKEFLLEVEGGQSYLERCKSDPDLPIYMVGIIQKGDTPNRNGRIYPFDILKKECDRYLKEDVREGQSYGECFTSDDFHVLTISGWKHFRDLIPGEEVITRNQNGVAEYKAIEQIVDQQYEGKVYSINCRNLITEVTANHKFLIRDRKGNIEYVKAEDLYKERTRYSHTSIIKSIQWSGIEKDKFIIPALVDYNGTNKKTKEKYQKALEIDTKVFCGLLGIFLAEGNCGKSSVYIHQNEGEKFDEIIELVDQLGLPYKIYSNKNLNKRKSISIQDVRLVNYLNKLGDKYTKFIPVEMKELASQYLEEILYWFNLGDGRKQTKDNGYASNRMNVFTVSQKLINDLHECWFKTGHTGNLTTQISKEDYLFADRIIKIKNKVPLFQLHMSSVDSISLDERFVKIEENNYSGRVYCLKVQDNHNFYVRQNGKHFWSGNCDHPLDSTVPELKNAAMTLEDIWYKGTEVWGKVKILNAFMPQNAPGLLIRGLILNGKSIGISSRALGSVYQNGSGYDIVDDDLEIICWDLVSKPSTYDANLKVLESKENKGNVLTESKCFGSNCNIKTSREIIKEKKQYELTVEDRAFLSILGVERFLQLKNA